MEGSNYGTQQEIVGVFQILHFYTKYLIFLLHRCAECVQTEKNAKGNSEQSKNGVWNDGYYTDSTNATLVIVTVPYWC